MAYNKHGGWVNYECNDCSKSYVSYSWWQKHTYKYGHSSKTEATKASEIAAYNEKHRPPEEIDWW